MSWLGRLLCKLGAHDVDVTGYMPFVARCRCRRCGKEWLQG